MTDRGPEHRTTFNSAKIPLILMFHKLNLLVALTTAPNQSYINLVERIMSLLNFAYQNVALERKESPSDDLIQKCRN